MTKVSHKVSQGALITKKNQNDAKARAFVRLMEYFYKSAEEYKIGKMMSMAESCWGEKIFTELAEKGQRLLKEEVENEMSQVKDEGGNNSMKSIVCAVCGSEIVLCRENHYIARDSKEIGVVSAFKCSTEPILYDAFDCSVCGCQNIIGERKYNKLVTQMLSEDDIHEDVGEGEENG